MNSKLNVIILTVVLIIGGSFVNYQMYESEPNEISSEMESHIVDNKHVKIDHLLLEKRIEKSIEVIIHHNENFNYHMFELKDRINYIFNDVSAFKISIDYDELMRVMLDENVEYIELVKKIEPLLLDSTKQMGIPSAFWSKGEFGSSNLSIAIVDSGIDANHSAFNDNLIASYNAIDNNLTAPFDNVGHGTHVAGIASSSTNMSGVFEESFRDMIPPACDDDGCPLSLAHQLENIVERTKINLKMDWGDEGEEVTNGRAGLAIFDPRTNMLACDECYIISDNGYIDQSVFINPGSYYIGILNEGNIEDEEYESSISYIRPDFHDSGKDINGVAFGSNIVAVKVLDAMTGGDIDDFDRGINWIIDNKLKYNIVVVNLSLGLNQTSLILDKLMEKLADNGILPVAAAGNLGISSGGVYSPASAPETLTVGSINRIGEIAYYTNVGSESVNGNYMKPDVLAPGGSYASNILGFETNYDLGFGLILAPDASLGYDIQDNDMIGYQGTSMASPHVAGLAALLASQLHEKEGWNWDTREHPMLIKQLIMTGTYEVGNIGIGRESVPNSNANGGPIINRDTKDFHEGWGAIDARAVANLLKEEVDIGFSQRLTFDFDNEKFQKTYAWKLNVSVSKNYVFDLIVNDAVDLDIKIISYNEDKSYFGEIDVIKSTNLGIGETERLIMNFENDDGIYVIVTIIDSDTESMITADFNILETELIPKLDIISPKNGETIQNPVLIEFETNLNIVNLLINETEIFNISNGYSLDELAEGDYNLTLYGYDNYGELVSDSVNFKIFMDISDIDNTTIISQNSDIDILAFNYYFGMLSIIFINVLRKLHNKRIM